MKAVAKNYPASGFLDPRYAASELSVLLEHPQPVSMAAAISMQQGCPVLHHILTELRWSAIPNTWTAFLRHLVKCACCLQTAPEVRTLQSVLSVCLILDCFILVSMQADRKANILCRFLTVLLERVTLTITVTCLHTLFVADCRSSRLTRAKLLVARPATSTPASTLG